MFAEANVKRLYKQLDAAIDKDNLRRFIVPTNGLGCFMGVTKTPHGRFTAAYGKKSLGNYATAKKAAFAYARRESERRRLDEDVAKAPSKPQMKRCM